MVKNSFNRLQFAHHWNTSNGAQQSNVLNSSAAWMPSSLLTCHISNNTTTPTKYTLGMQIHKTLLKLVAFVIRPPKGHRPAVVVALLCYTCCCSTESFKNVQQLIRMQNNDLTKQRMSSANDNISQSTPI